MTATRPIEYTDLHVEEFDLNAPVSEETLRKLVQNFNMVRALMPVAQVKAYHVNLSGVPTPNALLYQYCDGSVITDPTSPVSGGTTPTMASCYLRGKSSGGSETGGGTTADATHGHTTDVEDTYLRGHVLEEGNQRKSAQRAHVHDMPSTPLVFSLNPLYMQMCFYLRINV